MQQQKADITDLFLLPEQTVPQGNPQMTMVAATARTVRKRGRKTNEAGERGTGKLPFLKFKDKVGFSGYCLEAASLIKSHHVKYMEDPCTSHTHSEG